MYTLFVRISDVRLRATHIQCHIKGIGLVLQYKTPIFQFFTSNIHFTDNWHFQFSKGRI